VGRCLPELTHYPPSRDARWTPEEITFHIRAVMAQAAGSGTWLRKEAFDSKFGPLRHKLDPYAILRTGLGANGSTFVRATAALVSQPDAPHGAGLTSCPHNCAACSRARLRLTCPAAVGPRHAEFCGFLQGGSAWLLCLREQLGRSVRIDPMRVTPLKFGERQRTCFFRLGRIDLRAL
jgi:hypothetical protein